MLRYNLRNTKRVHPAPYRKPAKSKARRLASISTGTAASELTPMPESPQVMYNTSESPDGAQGGEPTSISPAEQAVVEGASNAASAPAVAL
ncbi:hypothetical protein HGRIS_009058 [Hohenbuehelia grisea]|uniref:Uncharacterized protein n=1 Tax=Hohenbuehelia grisea TaxID=104357 RepID=A0ABR3J0C7_9AGAR